MKLSRRCKVVIHRLRTRARKYFSETSLHGFRYITDPKSSKFKSYFWTIICFINTCLCFILIRSQFTAYYSNRITTTILTTAFPIWEVPFPAVTVCNFNLVYKEKTDKFKKLLRNQSTPQAIDEFFPNLSALVLSNKADKDIKWTNHYSITRLLERAGYNSESLMEELMHPCDHMVTNCYWNNIEKNCSELFFKTKTNSGFCCTFNDRQKKTNKEEIYVTGVGPSYGLYVHLNTEEDQYIAPTKHSSGIDVSVHQNIQYPDMSILSTTIRPGNDVSLSIKPEITQSEDTVRGIEMSTRGCAFAKEIEMEWTSNYSYATCVNRCKARVIKALCRCIPYYFHPVKGPTRFCTLPDLTCISRNKGKLTTSKTISFSAFRNGLTGLYKSSSDLLKCKCYPQCNEISYSYQVDQEQIKILDTDSRANESILRVYFGHVSCTKLQKSVLITWELILASVGGLIGLCLGGSILSIIEFFYNFVETLFARYKDKPRVNLEKNKYKPQLYLTDFKTAPKGKLFYISSGKSNTKNSNT